MRFGLIFFYGSEKHVLTIYQKLGLNSELTSGTQASLEKLQWIFLKLLIARDHLLNELGLESEATLVRDLEAARSISG